MTFPTPPLASSRDWLPHEEFPFESRYIDLGPHRVHYVDEGAGPALLLVNVGMWSFVFRDLMARLRRRFRVMALDFPGFGLSSAVEGPALGVAENSKLLEAFVEALDLRDITLLVHDVGGPVGLGFAARRPERIRALVVANTFAFPLRDSPAIRAMLAMVTSRAFDEINARTNIFARMTSTSFGVGRHLGPAGRRAFLGPWQRTSTRRASIAALRSIREIDRWMEDVERALTTTLADRPVLTVYGSRNDPFGWQERVGRMMPRSRHLRVAGGNHFPFADEPEIVAATVESWWDEDVQADATATVAAAEAEPPGPEVAVPGKGLAGTRVTNPVEA